MLYLNIFCDIRKAREKTAHKHPLGDWNRYIKPVLHEVLSNKMAELKRLNFV